MPITSVIVRTKDRPLLLRRALQSLSNQIFRDFDVILVNDGGNHNEVAGIVSQYNLSIKLLSNDRSVGRVEALNQGIRNSLAHYIAIHDDDDSWDTAFLNNMMETSASVNGSYDFDIVGFVGSLKRIEEEIYENEVLTLRILDPRAENATKGIVNFARYLMIEEDFYPIQVIFSRQAALDIGLFNPTFDLLEDREFFIRLLGKGEIFKVNSSLAFHHVRRKSESNSSYANTVTEDNKMSIYHNLLDNTLFRGKSNNAADVKITQLTPLLKEIFWAKQFAWKASEINKKKKRRISLKYLKEKLTKNLLNN